VLVVQQTLADVLGVVSEAGDLREDGLVDGDLVVACDDALRLVGREELVPGVVSDLLDLESGVRVSVEDVLQEVPGFDAHVRGDGVVALHDLLVEQLGVRVVEGQVPAEHRVEDHACGPDVHAEPHVLLPRYHLRCRVARRAAGRLEQLVAFVEVAQAEVDDLDVLVLVQQQVLGLEVSVDDAELVDVLDAGDDLLEELAGFLFFEPG
jgi:hypothetical protein